MLPQLSPTRVPRVFMTTDIVGGEWQYSLDLAQGLRAYDTATTLCVLGRAPNGEQRASARRVPGLNLISLDVALDWSAANPDQVIDAAAQVVGARKPSDGRASQHSGPRRH